MSSRSVIFEQVRSQEPESGGDTKLQYRLQGGVLVAVLEVPPLWAALSIWVVPFLCGQWLLISVLVTRPPMR